MKNFVIMLILAFCLYGCAAMPYKSNFTCPQSETGVCAPVENVYEASVYGKKNIVKQGEDVKFEDIDKLIKKLKSCSSSKDRKCIKETEAKLKEIFSSAVEIGEKKERMEIVGKVEDYRLSMIKQSPDKKLEIKPIVMKIIFAPYKTKENLLVSEHAIYKIVSYGDWTIDAEEGFKPHKLGTVY